MTAVLPTLEKLKLNPKWARLPLFDRKSGGEDKSEMTVHPHPFPPRMGEGVRRTSEGSLLGMIFIACMDATREPASGNDIPSPVLRLEI
jgi:hypothetical protein